MTYGAANWILLNRAKKNHCNQDGLLKAESKTCVDRLTNEGIKTIHKNRKRQS